jgi:hypothetical protein
MVMKCSDLPPIQQTGMGLLLLIRVGDKVGGICDWGHRIGETAWCRLAKRDRGHNDDGERCIACH